MKEWFEDFIVHTPLKDLFTIIVVIICLIVFFPIYGCILYKLFRRIKYDKFKRKIE